MSDQFHRMYELNDGLYFFELSEKEQKYFDACADMVEFGYTFRMIQSNWDIPKTNLHRFVHDDLKHLSYELYKLVLNQINWNIYHHRRNL